MWRLTHDLGIDLGTANVLIYERGRGIILREPAVVAVDKNTAKVLQVGRAAKNMLGRTPGNVVALHPLKDGVVSDYQMTEKMLTQFFKKVIPYTLIKPRVIVSVPSGITEVEERAVIQAAMEAGARRVYLMEEPLAAALGSSLDIHGSGGHMVVDIGGGTTDIAVMTMGDVAISASTKIAGQTFDKEIVRYLRRRYNLTIGDGVAEELKIAIGGLWERNEELTSTVKGRDAKTGLPRDVTITSQELIDVLKRAMRPILEQIVSVLEQTSPELVADIGNHGIVLTGGGAQLWGVDMIITQRTGVTCTIANEPETAVVLGCGKSLKELSNLHEGTINIARKRLLKE
ncbi:MAG: rod shape-determining protein [Eubacteriales bacterium]